MADGMWSLFSELHPGRNTWGVKARLVRAYKQPKFDNPNFLEYFTTILHDFSSKGILGSMRISIYEDLEEKKKLVEGKVYKIKNFCVMENNARTKTTRHEFRMLLHTQTSILDFVKNDFPMIMYAPRDLEDISLQQNIPCC
ncbi:hypothetical protein CASFOL_042789 [Castilleja foliolosa]|uniref:Replication protein A 70 kDa DNA-binding subunit B/D first OB fold domain-containing protein n=1 Tax=Castilleja foliolosa TaxID=1961234 RepID=A0ABD3B8B7_9LAMI